MLKKRRQELKMLTGPRWTYQKWSRGKSETLVGSLDSCSLSELGAAVQSYNCLWLWPKLTGFRCNCVCSRAGPLVVRPLDICRCLWFLCPILQAEWAPRLTLYLLGVVTLEDGVVLGASHGAGRGEDLLEDDTANRNNFRDAEKWGQSGRLGCLSVESYCDLYSIIDLS